MKVKGKIGEIKENPKSKAIKPTRESAKHHDAMIEAIEGNDPEKIVELTLEHWELSRNQIEKFARPDPLEFDLDKTG